MLSRHCSRVGRQAVQQSRQSGCRHRLFSTQSASESSSNTRYYTAGAALATSVTLLWYTRSTVKLDTGAAETSSRKTMFKLQTNDPPGENKGDQAARYISMADVAKHHLAQDCWVVVDGKVYDVTDFHKHHPGGSQIIVQNGGRDVTELFRPVHPPNTLETHLGPENYKGVIDPVEAEKSRAAFDAEQKRIAEGRAKLPPPETLLSLDEIQEAAESFLSPRTVNYYGAASLDGYSLGDNRSSFRKCRLLPRVMRDVLSVRPQTKIFGIESALPIYVSPSSNALLGHPDGELNITRGAAKTGIVQGVSAAASFALSEILREKDAVEEEIGERMGMVYQVYYQEERSKTEDQVREAVAGGCRALLLTVDSAVGDLRQTTSKMNGVKGDVEPGIKRGEFTATPPYHDARLNWDDLPRLKELAAGVPIYLKGVCHIDDVRMAKEHGLAGCILSNHGGRQLDQARTAFDSLRSIHAEDPQLVKDIEIYIDGGIRRGTDVLQALAFGARGVGLGRPFLYAQAAHGEKGVVRAVRILENEIITAMRLLGLTSLDQITPDMVECVQEIWK